jgi:hypothetical protein
MYIFAIGLSLVNTEVSLVINHKNFPRSFCVNFCSFSNQRYVNNVYIKQRNTLAMKSFNILEIVLALPRPRRQLFSQYVKE